MGEYADMLIDDTLFAEAHDVGDDALQQRCDENLWTTVNGSVVPLANMELRHLLNCIRWIERNGPTSVFGFGDQWLPKLNQELATRRQCGLASHEEL